jgi:hypothetical protein
MNLRALALVRRLGEVQGRGRFSEVLDMTLARTAALRVEGGDLVMDYVVPGHLTVDGRLCLSSAAALFDEVSSFNLIAADRAHRWGVSVALSAARTGLMPCAGERVTFRSRAVRIGRSLGSCDVALLDADGAEVVAGSHTKFLPNGIAGWDALVGGPLKPLALRLLASRAAALEERAPPALADADGAAAGARGRGAARARRERLRAAPLDRDAPPGRAAP